MKRLTERNVKLCEIKNVSHETFYYRLQEYENFLEDLGYNSFIELANDLKMAKVSSETNEKLLELSNKQYQDLKNTIPIPKYNIGDKVYTIDEKWNYGEGEPKSIRYINTQYVAWYKVYKPNKKQSKPSIAYRLKECSWHKAYLYFEKDLFTTEDEAKKVLEEMEK